MMAAGCELGRGGGGGRGWLPALVGLLLLAGCGGAGDSGGGQEQDGGNNPPPPDLFQPGDRPAPGCGGSGSGGYGGCSGGLDCSQDPCIHGVCHTQKGVGACLCRQGYAGTLCGSCAPGWEAQGLECLPSGGACASSPCLYGTCRELNGEAVCTCQEGYGGALCDRCAPGFQVEGLRCVVLDGGSEDGR